MDAPTPPAPPRRWIQTQRVSRPDATALPTTSFWISTGHTDSLFTEDLAGLLYGDSKIGFGGVLIELFVAIGFKP